MRRTLLVAVALLATLARPQPVPAQSAPTRPAPPRVFVAEGRVTRPAGGQGSAPVAVPGVWVVLHRVGSDRAAPLDSVRTGAGGRFRFAYQPSGSRDALYFLSSRYAGIAYFSPPLRDARVRGGDADIIVYDTTSDTTRLRAQGRHFVLSAPRGGRREVAEVFEISNEGTHTVVARDSVTPLWTTLIPAAAESVAVAEGDVSAAAVRFRNGRAEVFAPISPGVRQLVITYTLPLDAFPVVQPIARPTSVLEVLLEEPRATVEGAGLREVAPADIDGRIFRRFLAQDATAGAVLRVHAPRSVAGSRPAMRALAIAMAALMPIAFGVWLLRRRARPAVAPASEADRLVAELAALDARLEREPPASSARAAAEAQRAALKRQLERALAPQEPQT